MEDSTNNKNKYKSKILYMIIGLILLVILVSVTFYLFKSQKCGKDGGLIYNSYGSFCQYSFVCQDCINGKECPKCEDFCNSKSKEAASYPGMAVGLGKYCVCECKSP